MGLKKYSFPTLLQYDFCKEKMSKETTDQKLKGSEWNKALSDFWKMPRQPGMKYLPALVTVYFCLYYCPKRTSNKYWFFNETITKTRVNCENYW